MNLLPRSHNEFQSPAYWDQFFTRRGAKAFEWYGEYPELCGILHKYIKPTDKVLVVGCGNSQLSADLYDVGYHGIINIDISDVVIRQMNDKHSKDRPEMTFKKMDVLNMEFLDGQFGVVLDKGTLDALMVDESDGVAATIDKMFREIGRVLRMGGRYICISLLQEHILKKVLANFTEMGWPVRVHRVNTEESENSDKEFHMPIFAVVFTKFKKMPNMKQILEVASFEEKVDRFDTPDQVTAIVKEMQYYSLIRQQLSKRNVSGEPVSLSLYSEASTAPRYTLYIVDSPGKCPNKFAIFIVPQGREPEWLFSTDAGRSELSRSAGFERLVIVALSRNHNYESMDSIKAELSAKVMELSPPSFRIGTQVPFLSLGDDIGQRTVKYEGKSELSGQFVVEDVEREGKQLFRHLVFLSNQNVIQSEARLKTEGGKKKGKKRTKLVIDKSYLACQHHVAMVTGLAFVGNFKPTIEKELSVLLIGLGGGGLATFIHEHFSKTKLDVVDIDPSVVAIATEWFGFSEDEWMKVHIADGLEYIKMELSSEIRHDVVMFDVDSKDSTVGMSCPPQPFVETEFLKQVKELLLPQGVFILNLVCRNDELKKEVISKIQTIFQAVYLKDIESEVNQIVYALPEKKGMLDRDGVICKGNLDNDGVVCEGNPESDGVVSDDVLRIAGDNVKLMDSMLREKCRTTDVDLTDMFQDLRIIQR